MPKELFEITMFNAGTICNPSQTDIPSEAASNSLNLDPIAEDGKLKGIPENTKLQDAVGHEKNVLLQETIDPTEHDLISYKASGSGGAVWAAEDIYGGASSEANLGALPNATDDDVSMEAMEGAVYLGQGTADNASPQWIGRLDHGQWTGAAPDTLVMEEDTLLPPNMINETTTACSDGVYIYASNSGQGSKATSDSLKYASGEVTKIRISDGKVMARSNAVLGTVAAICLSWDYSDIWVLGSEKASISNNDTSVLTNTHILYKLNSNDLKLNTGGNIISGSEGDLAITTNLDALIKVERGGTNTWESMTNNTDHTGNRWEDEDSYWEGASLYDYQGVFSDMIELDGTLWVCTSAGAIFNTSTLTGNSITFTDRTPMGLGYYVDTAANTELYMPPGGTLNQTGGWYNAGTGNWNFPACFNGSLMQISNSNDHVGLYVRNGQIADMALDIGGSDEPVERMGLVFIISESVVGSTYIDGSNVKVLRINDPPADADFGVREIPNVMYKCPKDINKSAYNYNKDWTTDSFECNIREFDNPATTATHGAALATTEVEQYDTSQIPIRISDTLIVGLISDVLMSNHQQDLTADPVANRNKWRKMSKWTFDSGWTQTSFGDELYLSQRCHTDGMIKQTLINSSFHVANTGYFYRFSFMYDGFQESPLGAAMHIWSNGYKVEIPFIFSTDNFPKRVTSVRIYRATSISSVDRTIGGFYHFCGEVDITSQSEVNLSLTSYPDGHYEINEGDEIETSPTRLFSFTDHGTSGATYETLSGLFEAMSDSNIQYSLSAQLNNSLFLAKCKHHSQDVSTNLIYKSLPYKPSLINWALDFLKLPAVPTAIQAFNGRIYAFTESSTYKIEPNSFYLEDIFTGAGCIGPDAIYTSDFGICYCDSTNIYLNTGQTPIPIGDSILTSDAGIGYLDLLNVATFSPKVGFDATRKSFVIFVTQSKAWSYNVIRKVWNLWEYGDEDNTQYAKGICTGKNGEILLAQATSNDLFDMFSSATRKVWSWTSKRLSMRHKTQNKRWYEQIVAYEGTAPTVAVYWDYEPGVASIASGTSESNILRKQLGNTETAVNHRLIQTKITAGGVDTEVDSVGFTFRRFVKLIDQGAPS